MIDSWQTQQRIPLWSKLRLDIPLLCLLAALAIIGLITLYSATEQSLSAVRGQSYRFIGGLLLMTLITQIPPQSFKRWALWIYCGASFLLVLVLIIGDHAKGAQRWLEIPGVLRFQPAEIMKIAMPLMIAWYLSERSLPPRFLTVIIAFALILVPAALTALQPDLGTGILIATSGLIVLLLAGLSWKFIVFVVVSAIPSAIFMWLFTMHDYQKQRVLTFLDPERDPLGAGWNILQSTTAIGSGGFLGKGWLAGSQSHLDFLPESSTDFIIAVFSEEFGFVGICVLLTLYLLVVFRGLYITYQAQDTFSRLLAGTVSLTFFVYVFINMGMVSGILPVVGVPLPLLSYGGTSIITLMTGFGILMSVHAHRKLLPT